MLQSLIPYAEYIRCSPSLTTDIDGGLCMACGGLSPFSYTEVINTKLASQWGLSATERRGMSARESRYCVFCGCSARLRSLSLAISLTLGPKQHIGRPLPLQELIKNGCLDDCHIAEINSSGVLHETLKKIPKLSYSEYVPRDKKMQHQDLMALTYEDESFDLVLTSDTLEHVPSPQKALSEVYRVLKKGGYHIFTVPAFLNKEGRIRVTESEGGLHYNAPKSYHGSGEPDYLVWNEFGSDFIELVQSIGYDLKVYFMNVARLEDPSYVFVAQRPRHLASLNVANTRRQRVVSIDPTIPLTDVPSKYISVKTQKVLKDDSSVINESTQIELLGELVRKLNLTETHARNLENIVGDQKTTIDKLTTDIRLLERELRAIHESPGWKLISKAAAAKKRLRND